MLQPLVIYMSLFLVVLMAMLSTHGSTNKDLAKQALGAMKNLAVGVGSIRNRLGAAGGCEGNWLVWLLV